MVEAPVSLPGAAPPARRRLQRVRRDDSGLTTLEWLLIVAAVAGLAALAVVIVTNVVTETAEQIEGSAARLTTAQIQADSITQDARAATIAKADDILAMNDRYGSRCRRLNITYASTFTDVDPPQSANWKPGADNNSDNDLSGPNEAPECSIGDKN
ncbi:hypothetical protein [Candidatus Poriferisodalis sp.]|uniref:hypothetical protein n=1 Tax=Candidatus Poriferisodalis sp. TaxID=3101277 RepID=UPI003B014006